MISICEYIYVRVWKRKSQTQKKSGYVLLFVPKCAQPPNHPTIHHSPHQSIMYQKCASPKNAHTFARFSIVARLLWSVICLSLSLPPSPAHTHTHIPSLTSTHTHTLSPNWEFAHTAFQWGRVPRTKLSYGSLPCNRDRSCQNVLLTPHMTTHKNNKTKNIYNVCLSGPRRSIVRPLVSHKESSWLVQATVCCVSSWSTGRSVFLSVCRPGGSRLPDAVMALSCESMDICVANNGSISHVRPVRYMSGSSSRREPCR